MGKKLDFKKINAMALAQSESVVSRFAPNGKREGREWVALNPRRADNSRRSFSVNLDTGIWCDFATDDRGGDLISYVAYVLGLSQGDALKTLAGYLGVADTTLDNNTPPAPLPVAPRNEPKAVTFTPIFPIPPEAVKSCPVHFARLGKASAYWDYKNASGDLLMRVCRFDRDDSSGQRVKDYRPVVYGIGQVKGNPRTGWHWRQLPDNRPLYGLEQLPHFPASAPVILVEGEKACDASGSCFLRIPA